VMYRLLGNIRLPHKTEQTPGKSNRP
jgi:hypothetical protein